MKLPERDDPRELLWELPRAGDDDDRPAPPDADLADYRSGTLPAASATRLEWHLTRSRRGRERLSALAGIDLTVSARPGARRGGRRLVAAAAVALAATLAFAALLMLERGSGVGTVPEFDVRAEGIARVRALPAVAAAAAPEGRVRVVIEPRGEAVAGLTFAAYRLEGEGLARLAEPGELETVVHRGSAVLTARADRLVGRAPGTRPFFVVVTDRRRLPGRLAATGGTPEAGLRAACGGRAYRVPLTVLERTQEEDGR